MIMFGSFILTRYVPFILGPIMHSVWASNMVRYSQCLTVLTYMLDSHYDMSLKERSNSCKFQIIVSCVTILFNVTFVKQTLKHKLLNFYFFLSH